MAVSVSTQNLFRTAAVYCKSPIKKKKKAFFIKSPSYDEK